MRTIKQALRARRPQHRKAQGVQDTSMGFTSRRYVILHFVSRGSSHRAMPPTAGGHQVTLRVVLPGGHILCPLGKPKTKYFSDRYSRTFYHQLALGFTTYSLRHMTEHTLSGSTLDIHPEWPRPNWLYINTREPRTNTALLTVIIGSAQYSAKFVNQTV